MSPLNDLTPAPGSTHRRRRVGRGQGSGRGGTSTRGHNGAQSRSGYKRKIGFEGGQQPLQRRVPKLGMMHPVGKISYKTLNLDRLETILQAQPTQSLTISELRARNLIGKHDRVKILGRGELNAQVSIEAHAFSKSALSAIEKQGGKAIQMPN